MTRFTSIACWLALTLFAHAGFGFSVTPSIKNTVGSVTEKYHYDGADIMLQKTSTGTIGTRYFRSLGIDEPWQRADVGAATTNRVYLADALGSVVALADTNKVIQTEYDYEPFGATTTTGAGNKNAYKFTAREDDATGLYFYRARYYHPALGRFLGEDPLEYDGGDINLYAYVGNDPINARDPLGLAYGDTWDPITYLNSGFGEGWSAGGLGVVSVITPDDWWKRYYKWGYGVDVDCGAWQTGKTGGYVAATSLSLAGGVWAWQAAGLATFSVSATTAGGNFHVFYSVTADGVTTWLHGAGVAGSVVTSEAAGLAGFATTWNTVSGIPIVVPAAATAVGIPAYNCVTAAWSAFVRGWGGWGF